MTNKKTAVILFNLGGPSNLQSVKPFLFNLFNDKAIINLPFFLRFFLAKLISNRRNKKAQEIYKKIGGKSPILEITSSQADNLEKSLSFYGDFKAFVSMRYSYPQNQDIIKKILEYNPDEIILLPLYPQFSTSTTASSFEDFLKRFNKKIKIKKICCYFKEDDFILSHAKLIKQTIDKLYDKNLSEFRFLFSAHGLPQKLIDQGDPYVFQIEESTKNIISKFSQIINKSGSEIDFKVCYQSKVGPLRWTSPSLETEIRRVSLDKKIPVIIPIAFVSDHSETLVELDIEYKELANSLGIKDYLRVPSLNNDGHFIDTLTKICLSSSNQNETIFSGCSKEKMCDKKFIKCWRNYAQ